MPEQPPLGGDQPKNGAGDSQRPSVEPLPPPRPSRVGATLKALFRARVTAGLITVLPVVVTIWLVRIVFEWTSDASKWVVDAYIHRFVNDQVLGQWGFDFEKWDKLQERLAEVGQSPTSEDFVQFLPAVAQWVIAIVSVVLTILFLYIIGFFAANIAGRRTIEFFERLVDRVPFVKTIYRSSKQIIAAFSGEQTQNFQRVALIPFPQEKMRSVGFVTSTFYDSITREELASVFIPTTPNPTTGYLQVLKRSELVELDWTIEEAVRTIMSGGMLRPDFLTMVPTGQVKEVRAKLAQQKAKGQRAEDFGKA